jgi:hypothetical protein
MNRNDLFGFSLLPPPSCQRKDRNFFLNRYFQSRPEIFANPSDGSQVTPAVSAAMNRASDVTSKMVMGGLRHAAASNNASRPGGNGNGNANTMVSSFSAQNPFFGWEEVR